MFKKSLLKVIAGLVTSLLLSGIVYYNLVLDTLDIFGYSELKNPEARHAKIFYTSLTLTLLTSLFAVGSGYFKQRDFATGFFLPALIGFLPMIAMGPTYFDKSNYYESFEEERWLSEKESRLKMARHLIRTKELIGLNRQNIIRKLGTGSFENGEMNYTIIEDFCFLGIRFENNKVTDYSLWVRD